MKICWDMLEGARLIKSGTFRKNQVTYVYKESCTKCGESYLAEKRRQSKVCGHSCAIGEKNHYMYGKTHTIEVKKRMSESSKGKFGSLNPNYRGGREVFTIYNTQKSILGLYEDIRKQEGTKLLEVRCVYCGRWFTPTRTAVDSRLAAINNLNKGEQRLYCSENCKQACPTYNRKIYPKGFKHATSREVDPYLRQMVFERDNWTCQICGKTIKEAQLHCHHIKGYAQNKMLANDVDNCITLCKECHKEIHSRIGYRYVDLQCKNKQS
jgi:5-methylcytosine-specific restriction endonuclease McrA